MLVHFSKVQLGFSDFQIMLLQHHKHTMLDTQCSSKIINIVQEHSDINTVVSSLLEPVNNTIFIFKKQNKTKQNKTKKNKKKHTHIFHREETMENIFSIYLNCFVNF